MSANEILTVLEYHWPTAGVGKRWVTITGGEPALQLTVDLVDELHLNNWRVAVETNGSIPNHPLNQVDWLTVSPKKGLPLCVFGAHELKVVLPGAAPGKQGWLDDELENLARQFATPHLFVQPQDPIDPTLIDASHLHRNLILPDALLAAGFYENNVQRCLAFVRSHSDWRISAQVHKCLGLK